MKRSLGTKVGMLAALAVLSATGLAVVLGDVAIRRETESLEAATFTDRAARFGRRLEHARQRVEGDLHLVAAVAAQSWPAAPHTAAAIDSTDPQDAAAALDSTEAPEAAGAPDDPAAPLGGLQRSAADSLAAALRPFLRGQPAWRWLEVATIENGSARPLVQLERPGTTAEAPFEQRQPARPWTSGDVLQTLTGAGADRVWFELVPRPDDPPSSTASPADDRTTPTDDGPSPADATLALDGAPPTAGAPANAGAPPSVAAEAPLPLLRAAVAIRPRDRLGTPAPEAVGVLIVWIDLAGWLQSEWAAPLTVPGDASVPPTARPWLVPSAAPAAAPSEAAEPTATQPPSVPVDPAEQHTAAIAGDDGLAAQVWLYLVDSSGVAYGPLDTLASAARSAAGRPAPPAQSITSTANHGGPFRAAMLPLVVDPATGVARGWVAYVAVDSPTLGDRGRHWLLAVAGAGAVLALMAGITTARTARSYVRPLMDLSRAADEFGRSGATFDLSLEGSDEISVLARSLESMTQQVRRRSEAQRRDNEARLRAILNTAAEGIITIDDEGTIETFNREAERCFGYKAAEVVGQNVSRLMPEDEASQHDEHLAKYRMTLIPRILGVRREVVGRRKDGSEFPMELTVSEFRVGQRRMFTGVLRDITQRKRDERVLLEMNAALGDARDRAVESSQAKSAFMANMSHELRTPLNAIIGYSEMLAEDALSEGHHALVPDLEKIQTAGRQLLGLINDILDLSKIEANRMQLCLEEFEVGGLVREVSQMVFPLMEKNGNQLHVECSPQVGQMRADTAKLRQSLLNLLSNAAKFTHEGRVDLTVRRTRRAGRDWIEFEVRDTGIGIDEQQIQTLFEEFTQADASTTRKYGGTGLGLAITRKFCQLMGGDVRATSQVGAGSTFVIELPAEVVAPAATGSRKASLEEPAADA